MTTTTLKSLIAVSKDGEWGKGEPSDDAVAMGVIRGTDFGSIRIGDVTELPTRYIPKRIAERKTLQPHDIVFETAGGSKDSPTGRCVYIAPSIMQRATLPLTCASFSRFIRIDPSKADPRFVFWYLQYLYSSGYIRQYHTQHTGVARFQFTVFSENEPLYLPPLATQRKIASILSAYDDLIENNTRRIAILEEMAQALCREWFVYFRFPGHEQVRMVESEMGAVPEGWEVKRLSSLVETQYGYTESASEAEIGPKYVRGMDINKASYIVWDTVPYCPISSSDYDKYKLAVGDVLVIRMADPGKVGMIEKDIDAVFASYLIRLKRASPLISPFYLFYFLLSERYQSYISGASTGTTRKSASAGVITDHYLCTFEGRTCSIAHRAVQAWCRSTLATTEVRYASTDYMYGWPAAP
ncbi:MAG TPA: restriction endonuclease subunit S, partial [Herpetosiphonaceae bacterium]|nr:restriction endonuclease subunit S [Herpetosiphonaceae bacterium]